MWKFIIGLLLFYLGSLNADTLYRAEQMGIKPGKDDSGPAIQRALKKIASKKGPAVLRFEKGKIYYLKTSPVGPWVFNLKGMKDFTIDGRGACFFLGPGIAFADVQACENIRIENLNIDHSPLPFAEALVIRKNPEERYIDVKVLDEFDLPPLGGPTREKGEQAYFGMLWKRDPDKPGVDRMTSKHMWIKDTREASSGSLKRRIIRVFPDDNFNARAFDFIIPGETHITLPVRNVAHFGGREVFQINKNTDVYLSDIELWSAPWFGFGIMGNRGEVIFRRVNIRPRPGTGRITSIWRDAFHVTANYARLVWEDCNVQGNNDDDFNIKTFHSRLIKIISPTRIQVRQNFPLDIVPFYPGDTVSAFDIVGGKRLNDARVVRCEGKAETISSPKGRLTAPVLTLTLDRPIQGLKKWCVVWNKSSANPDTIIRRCRLRKSCRFQCSLTIEDSEMDCFSWFYGNNIEGPYPLNIVIRNSVLFWGRGEGHFTSVTVAGPKLAGPGKKKFPLTERVINSVLMENNIIYGNIEIAHAKKVTLKNNKFKVPGRTITLENSRNILLVDTSPARIIYKDEATKRAVKKKLLDK